jgi:hypothetical protein
LLTITDLTGAEALSHSTYKLLLIKQYVIYEKKYTVIYTVKNAMLPLFLGGFILVLTAWLLFARAF